MSDVLKRFEEALVRLGSLNGLPPPAFPTCLGGTGALEHLLAALEEASAGRWNAVVDAIRSADKASDTDARRAHVYKAAGLLRYLRGDWEGAAEAYADALARAESAADETAELESLAGLGNSELKRANTERAEDLFHRGLERAADSGRRDLAGTFLAGLGRVCRVRGDSDGALGRFSEAREVFKEIDDGLHEVAMLVEQGAEYRTKGDYARAVEILDSALGLSAGQPVAMAKSLVEMGRVHVRTCDYEAAKQVFQRARDIAEEIGDQRLVSSVYNNLGNVHFYECDYSSSIQAYEKALAINRRLGDQAVTSHIIHNLGSVFFRKGDYPAALRAYEQALELERRQGNTTAAARCLGNVGIIRRVRCEFGESIAAYREALQIDIERDDVFGQSVTMSNLSSVYLEIGGFDEAGELLEKTLELNRRSGIPVTEAHCRGNLGLLEFYRGDFDRAEELLSEALRIHAGIKNHFLEAWTLNSLGRVACERGDDGTALEHFTRALDLHRRLDHREGQAESMSNRGLVLSRLGRWGGALADLKGAAHIAEGIQNPVQEARVMCRLGEVLVANDDYVTAHPLLMRSYRVFHRYGVPLERTEALGLLGRLARGLGHGELACAYLRAAVEGYTSLGALPGRIVRLNGLLAECGAGIDSKEVPDLDLDTPPEIPLASG
ncbi:MAG TPA: tetratricopeptide repeat protein [bacterium]|nr:tetratricopeptide repeat protein [bacterium]